MYINSPPRYRGNLSNKQKLLVFHPSKVLCVYLYPLALTPFPPPPLPVCTGIVAAIYMTLSAVYPIKYPSTNATQHGLQRKLLWL